MHPLFDSLQLFLDNFTYLSLLMTFGAVFPPLAFSFVITTFLMNKYAIFKLDRFIIYAKEKNRLDYVEVIDSERKGCFNSKVVMRSMWMIVCISCCFYTLFLFDTLRIANGVESSYWVLIVMLLVPLFNYIVYRLLDKYFWGVRYNGRSEGGDNVNDFDRGVEVITIGNPIINI